MPDKKEVKQAFIALMLFKHYTILPRWMELSFSLCAWGNLIAVIIGIYSLFN